MYNKPHALVFSLVLLIVLLPGLASGAIDMGITDSAIYHSPNHGLDINVTITHDEYIDRNAHLKVYVDAGLAASIGLYDLLRDPMNYSYNYHSFGYNVTADGINTWEEYPEVEFSYQYSASGYSGNDCDEYWYSGTEFISSTIISTDNLKEVMYSVIGLPGRWCVCPWIYQQ